MQYIQEEFIKNSLTYQELIHELKLAFRTNQIQSPSKSVYEYTGIPKFNNNFLFMPAWDNKTVFGTKLITTTPNNVKINEPYIKGVYILFDARNGSPLVCMDAKFMTSMRTAAASALAASYLISKKAKTLLVLGNGNLAPFFIKAHFSVHEYKKIYLWGRNISKSKIIKEALKSSNNLEIELIDNYKNITANMDVISCITSSKDSLLEISDISNGQHLDLVGSYTPKMQEVSTSIIQNCRVFTDNLDSTPNNSGEIIKAISEQLITKQHILGDLSSLCQDDFTKRNSETENTLFKSTGMALEDLVTANLIYKKFKTKNK
ncbi:ornithine cyclodeaminase family protein [Joostella sp.]|uniref:ornithine cyclodeaminase family protein n=1 Tax=Joostella sp. TaxID=2231138 RepID=UPI003A901474